MYVDQLNEATGDYEFLFSQESEVTEVVIEDLALQSSYRVTVTAFNSVGESDASSEIIVETQRATAPEAPSNVAAAIEGDQISVSWSAPFNGGAAITSYNVVFRAQGNAFVQTDNCQPGLMLSCSFNANTLKAAPFSYVEKDRVFVKVTASNAEGESESEQASVLLPAQPDAIVSAATSENSLNSVLVQWVFGESDGGNAIKASTIHLFHADDLLNEIRSVEVAGDINTHVVGNLLEDHHYSFRVSVANHMFQSEPSEFFDFQTQGPPDAPLDHAVSQVGSDSVELNWSAPFDGHSEIESYSLFVYEDDILVDVVEDIQGESHTYEARPATDYTFTVGAVNARGQSVESTAVSATTTARTPDAPTNGVVMQALSDSLTVNFLAPLEDGGDEISAYVVYVRNVNGDLVQPAGRVISMPVTIDELEAETTYSITVTAENAFGEGPASKVLLAETAEAPKLPSNPSNIRMTSSTVNSISIAFDAAPAVPQFPVR